MKNLRFLLLLLWLLSFGCKPNTTPASNLPTVGMNLGKKFYTLEIAATEEVRNKGLMFRDSMADDHGMIFIFTDEKPIRFWMKNTRIPLDIVFLAGNGQVVSIKRMEPYLMKGTASDGSAKYAVELNDGQAQAAGIMAGDLLQIPEAVKNTKAEPSIEMP